MLLYYEVLPIVIMVCVFHFCHFLGLTYVTYCRKPDRSGSFNECEGKNSKCVQMGAKCAQNVELLMMNRQKVVILQKCRTCSERWQHFSLKKHQKGVRKCKCAGILVYCGYNMCRRPKNLGLNNLRTTA